MNQLKGLAKVLIIFAVLIGILVLWIIVTTEDYELDNSLENIDDTKFPITDYLYFDSPLDNPYVYNQNNNQNLNNSNQGVNNGAASTNSDASNNDDNSNNNSNNSNNGEEIANNASNDKKEDSNTIKDLFDNSKKFLEQSKDEAGKLTNEIFTNKVDEKTLKQRTLILATRNSDAKFYSPYKNPTNQISYEYGVDAISNLKEKDVASNEHKLYRTISAMKMIPAVLLTNISSDIGGKVIAQVEEDIYAEMGKAILIPKGSKVLGNYANNNKIGEYRLNIFWTRILTPQGVNIMLTDAYGADIGGAMGVIGDLDSKYWQRYGIPLALSTISNGLILTINNATANFSKGDSQLAYMNSQLTTNMQGDISNIMEEIIKEQVKIQPTIRIEKGSRIFITSNKDIFFPIPQKGEVMARFFDEVKITKSEVNNAE